MSVSRSLPLLRSLPPWVHLQARAEEEKRNQMKAIDLDRIQTHSHEVLKLWRPPANERAEERFFSAILGDWSISRLDLQSQQFICQIQLKMNADIE